jgi:hypothetical protein
MTNETPQIAQNPETQADSDWFLAETTRTDGFKKALWRMRYSAGRKACFFSKAPETEGIPKEQQETNRLKLMLLKFRARLDKLGVTLTFAEKKRLALSDKSSYYRNFDWGISPSFEIDDSVRPLALALNKKSYTYSGQSCSGHLKENPENPSECIFYDTGYITIQTDETNDRAQELMRAISNFCEKESEVDPDCKYFLIDNEDGSYTLRWNYSDPEFEEAKRDLYRPGIQNTEQEIQILRRIRDLSPKAKEKKITEKHTAFLQNLSRLVENF